MIFQAGINPHSRLENFKQYAHLIFQISRSSDRNTIFSDTRYRTISKIHIYCTEFDSGIIFYAGINPNSKIESFKQYAL